LVEGLETLFFLGFSALGFRISLFDFFWPFAIVPVLRGWMPPLILHGAAGASKSRWIKAASSR
jgi:hypothetical protein